MSFIDDGVKNEAGEEHIELEQKTPHVPVQELELQNKLDIALRALAQSRNDQARLEAYSQRQQKMAIKDFTTDLLDVRDNLERAMNEALESFKKEGADSHSSLASLIEGLKLVQKQMDQVFEKFSVKKVPGVGTLFDPNHHQSIGEEPCQEVPTGHVSKILQEGYFLHQTLIRPALVMVSK